MRKIKILVAHPGKQHSFELARAINKNDCFELIYATSVYYKSNSKLMKIINCFSSSKTKERLNNRKSSTLNDDQVIQFYELLGLFRIFLAHYDKKQKLFHKCTCIMANLFGKKVAKYAIKNKVDIVICYDTFSKKCFEYLNKKNKNIIKIMDASAANLIYQRNIYVNDMKKTPLFKNKLLSEIDFTLNEKMQEYYKKEIDLTDYIISASEFTKKSYVYSDFDPNNIFVCPYGINMFEFKNKPKQLGEKVNFIFLGGTKQAKGLSYLLDAFLELPDSKATLTIVGVNNLSEEIYKSYSNKINFIGKKLHSEIPNLLEKAHVMIFPSLSDGFGFAGIEAMAMGCPLVCSENTGIADMITDGSNGFVIPIQSKKAIYDKMMWFINNRSKIESMGINAKSTVEKYTWENYDNNIKKILEIIVKKGILNE